MRNGSRLAVLSALFLAGCAGAPPPPAPVPPPALSVEVLSEPASAAVSFRGKEIGSTPTSLGLSSFAELLAIDARRAGQEVSERRIRFLSPQKARVSFRFGEPGPLAKRLGLARVLIFDFSENVSFDSGRAELKPDGLAVLEKQAEMLRTSFAGVDVFVCGHTDSTGSNDLNLRLSLDRAQAVAGFLAGKGVPPGRLKPQGFGKEYPVETNGTPEGRAANRRTELVLPQ